MREGANPILYAYQDQEPATSIRALMDRAMHDADDPIWKITPFVDMPGDYGGSRYRFEWEREWRKVGNLHFDPSDVAFLIIPEECHDLARDFFIAAERDEEGPNYPCPFIDAYWDAEQIGTLGVKIARERQAAEAR
jgi:hypothetical protein